jgi:hypothetical protein
MIFITPSFDLTSYEGKPFVEELERMAGRAALDARNLYPRLSPGFLCNEYSDSHPWVLDPEVGTGRTTRMILHALLAVEAGTRVRFNAPVLRQSSWITRRARQYAVECGLNPRLIAAPISDASHQDNRAGFHGLTFHDHSYRRVTDSRCTG